MRLVVLKIFCLSSESMAGPRLSQSSGHSRWKQWWRRSPNTCCSKKILLLLVWQVLFAFSWSLLVADVNAALDSDFVIASQILSFCCAPLIGWFADVKFGRYEVIKIGSLASFLASIFVYFAITTGDFSTTGNVLLSVATGIVYFGFSCYSTSILPFLTDQLIGATSNELSIIVRWYYWAQVVGIWLSGIVFWGGMYYNVSTIGAGIAVIFAVPLALIIISDCLCQQWLDRTHKVTNPIKLIIQVLNYTRKHSYPERRSAFTYIDEEQPTRMDYGKEKFGGPFTEEEVEDVKTVLRLLPLVICLTFYVSTSVFIPTTVFSDNENIKVVLNIGLKYWLLPVLLIPLYQLLLYRCFQKCSPSMLRCIGAGLFMNILGCILLQATGVWGVVVSDDVQRYLSCTEMSRNATESPDMYVEWYWKLGPYVMFGVGKTIASVLLLEFVIAQSPEKMKGLVIGIMLTCVGFVDAAGIGIHLHVTFTLCYDVVTLTCLVVLFVVFLVFSKRYTLRERNREINIQAIVEEHYERYLDQEEEYMRQQHY